ncbi:transposase [Massilia putida]|uniref:transposase n=1 Tax=Massilia putida TaxID=1141883 RepID=UPI00351D6BAE
MKGRCKLASRLGWHLRACASWRKYGLGMITASAVIASVGDAKNFTNGRQLAAWPARYQSCARPAGRRVCRGSARAATRTCTRC